MKKLIIISVLLFAFASFFLLNAQSRWARSYGGVLADSPNSIQQTKDGGFIVGGQTFSFGGGFWLLKLYPNGEIEWEKSYGNAAWGAIVRQTADEGYIVAGTTNLDIWVLKLFPNGEIEWQRTYGGVGEEVAYSVQQTIDGGYIVGGYTTSFGSGNSDIWILKLSSYGDIRWEKRNGSGFLSSIKQTSEGGYIIAGQTPVFGVWNLWVLKLFPSGEAEWSHTYGGNIGSIGDIVQTSDGGYAVASGTPDIWHGDFWILKLFADGEVDWQYTYGWQHPLSGESGDMPYSIQQTNDGGYIIAGESSYAGGYGSDARILKLYSNGEREWERIFDFFFADRATSIIQARDGDFVVAVVSNNPGQSNDIFVLKMSSSGDIDPSCNFLSTSNASITKTAVSAVDFYVQAINTTAQTTVTAISPQNTNAIMNLLCKETVPNPVISTLSPNSGPVGIEVTISGSNFGPSSGRVTFNGAEAAIATWSDTEIKTSIPAGATTGPVVMYTSDGRNSNSVVFTVTISIPPATVSELSPNSGAVGTSVTIRGSNFGASQGTVTFNGISALITSWTDSQIVTIVPSGAATGPIVVHTSDGRNSNGVTFTVSVLPNAQWARMYQNSVSDSVYSIKQTSDGGYIAIGYTIPSGSVNPDVWILKLFPTGEIDWQKNYGGSEDDVGVAVQQTNDGGYVVLANTLSFDSGRNIWILKLFPSGNIEWQRTYLSPNLAASSAASIQQTDDGGYIVAGYCQQVGSGNEDILVLKLFPNGNIEWQRSYDSTSSDYARCIQQTSDGGYIIIGQIGFGQGGFFIMKVFPNGSIEWNRSYPEGSNYNIGQFIVQTNDGGYIAAGHTLITAYGPYDILIMKFSPIGDIEWQRKYDSSGTDYAYSIQQTTDGRYVAIGGGGYGNVWVLKLFTNGDLDWQRAFGDGNLWQIAHSVQQTIDDGYIIAGHHSPFYDGYSWGSLILKISSIGEIVPSCAYIKTITASVSNANAVPLEINIGTQNLDFVSQDTNIGPQNTHAAITDPCQAAIPQPIISSLSIYSGTVGTQITIFGSHFGSSQGKVKFNGLEAAIASWSDTEIKTTVPSGATTGSVIVQTSNGKDSNGVTFTVTIIIPSPFISAISPNSALVGTEVTISGSNFGSASGMVTFNGVLALVTSWTDTQIMTVTPPGSTTGLVIVHTSDGRDSNGKEFIVVEYKANISVVSHWYNWASTFAQYQEIIKSFEFVRDEAWWSQLEQSDYTSDVGWGSAQWSYSYVLPSINCESNYTYQSGYDELVKKFQHPNSPELLLLLSLFNENLNINPNAVTYNQYYDYVYHVVERYDGDGYMDMPGLVRPVRFFEIGNEPDDTSIDPSTNHPRNKGLTLENYVDNRLIPAYLAAKAANPNAKILNAGLRMIGDKGFDTSYLESMLKRLKKNQGKRNQYYFDRFAFHYYFDPQDPEYFERKLDSIKSIMKDFEIDSKPIWITEYGIATKRDAGGEIREEDQASVLIRFASLMEYYGISKSFIYVLKDKNSSDPTDWENVFGLHKVACQGTKEIIQEKKAMPALRLFAGKIKGLNAESINSQGERHKGIYRLIFSIGTKKVQIIWYTKLDNTGVNPDYSSETTTVSLSLGGKNGILSDMYGKIINPNVPDGTSITIGEKPFYIEY